MTISIHLISVPSDEVVTSRVIYLPEAGGEFGRSASCDISLPDQSKRISRVHGSIRRTEVGYSVKSTGQNTASLNDKAMVRDKDYPLNDGDILKVESYTMLVSTLVSTKVPQDQDEEDSAMFSEPFSLQIDNDDTDFLDEATPSVSNEKKEDLHKKAFLQTTHLQRILLKIWKMFLYPHILRKTNPTLIRSIKLAILSCYQQVANTTLNRNIVRENTINHREKPKILS